MYQSSANKLQYVGSSEIRMNLWKRGGKRGIDEVDGWMEKQIDR